MCQSFIKRIEGIRVLISFGMRYFDRFKKIIFIHSEAHNIKILSCSLKKKIKLSLEIIYIVTQLFLTLTNTIVNPHCIFSLIYSLISRRLLHQTFANKQRTPWISIGVAPFRYLPRFNTANHIVWRISTNHAFLFTKSKDNFKFIRMISRVTLPRWNKYDG